jgi:lipopolysaccharide/colanic/teichoic acid biosynthesis glycosyltransferase
MPDVTPLMATNLPASVVSRITLVPPSFRASKRLLDITLAVCALIPLTFLFLIIGLAIKLDSRGGVFFRQPRIGYKNQVFSMWKFRTMYSDRADLLGARLTEENDPRITRVGAWLRKSSMDELPQVINVLFGSMSFVGPRPHPLQAKVGDKLYQDVVPGYHRRHVVLPGITGWAQVNGWRGETIEVYQIQQRVRHDIEYVSRQSLWFDLHILARTALCVLRCKAF